MGVPRPQRLDGFFKRGSLWAISYTRRQANGEPVDITGLRVRATFRQDSEDGEAVLTLDSEGGGITVPAPDSGKAYLRLSADQTRLFAPNALAVFDIEYTSPDDPDYEWHSPTLAVQVRQEVTRND